MPRVFTDPRCLEHRVPYGFPERPERLERLLESLVRAGLEVEETGDHPAAPAVLETVHGAAYLERFERAVGRGDGLLDSADNPLSPGTWAAARAAVGAALHAADWAWASGGRSAFAAVRPPGHHAERELAMGFCYFNNVAVAAEHLRGADGCERLAIVDPDVHHGNGTQHIFERRGDVFYASLHQHPLYPGTGAASERGTGEGAGATLNVPLAAGTGDDGYRQAFDEQVLPALESFEPRMLLVSIGFDAWKNDPVGGMRVTRRGYETWGRRLGGLARRSTGGRVLSLLEGGYDVAALGDLALAWLEGLDRGLG